MTINTSSIGRRRLLVTILQLWDVTVAAATLVVLGWHADADMLHVTSLGWMVVSLGVWHLCFSSAKLYESRRLTAGAAETADVVRTVALATTCVTAAAFVFDVHFFDVRAIVSLWAVSTLVVVVGRRVVRRALASIRRSGRNLRHVLLVGSGPRARRVHAELSGRPELGYRVVGYIDDTRDTTRTLGPYLGALGDVSAVLAANVVDEVFVALPIKSCYEATAHVLRSCEEQGVRVTMPLDFFDAQFASCHLDVVDDIPQLRLTTHRVLGWHAIGKRVFDVVGAAIALVVVAPVLVAIAAAIRITSPGPVFFRQVRIGLNKRGFSLLKFRTMVVDAEARLPGLMSRNEVTGPVFKLRDDPRVTPVGRFLRRTSLDELPQLINVLLGHMSLVGPRPLPVRDVEGFPEHWQRKRFSLKPGITCFWQVSGRSQVPFDRWMELDMDYIDNWSFSLDIKLLALTIPTLLRRTGAY